MPSSDSTAPDRKQLLKRALLRIESLESRLAASEQAKHEPIAIVGMGCRFAGGARGPQAYWELLRSGVDAISDVPPDRWRPDDYLDPDPDAIGKAYVMRGGFLDDVDLFDASFFGISPREAEHMDPQQRLLLEVSWEALEDAGIAPERVAGTQTGAFVGMTANDFIVVHMGYDAGKIDTYSASGNSQSIAAGRIAYALGLRGPAMTVDTACSAAMVAVHLACHSLRAGECRTAVAGGVLLILSPEGFVTCCKSRLLSPDGHCKTFDASADGYVRAEGCAMLTLKKLRDAEEDGDNILAVIRGSAINQDGRSSGLTAPSGRAQEAVLRQALKNAGVSATDVSYIETHGTGTSLGDPIEVQAISAVHAEGRDPEKPLLIGSVKTNIGHTEGVAGVAGIIKVVLALQHRKIPPHLHFDTPNPLIPWDDIPIRVTSELTDWPEWADRRIAGVSSFGFSGTNVHMIIEEAPQLAAPAVTQERPLHVMAVSGRREAALTELARDYQQRLLDGGNDSVADLCYMANAGRSHFEHRAAVIGASRQDLAQALEACGTGLETPRMFRGKSQPNRQPTVAFLFTGQGSQHVGMGRELYRTQPTFRAALDKCDELLRDKLEHSLLSVLYPPVGREQEASSILRQTGYTQPALFALEWALAELWRSWGVVPSVVMGHSVGEFAAACVAGVLSLEDGLALIAERGRLMQALPEGGSMAAIFADQMLVTEAIAPCSHRVSIAAVNGPENVVISGPSEDIDAVLRELEGDGVSSHVLDVSHAFHSPLMQPALQPFFEFANAIDYAPARIDFVSTITGRAATARDVTTAAYWRDQILSGVRFRDAMQTLGEEGCQIFVEIGPGTTLLGMGRSCLAQSTAQWLPSLHADKNDWNQMLASLAAMYTRGVNVDWVGFDRDYPRRMMSLPTYPFERQSYPIYATTAAPATPLDDSGLHPLLGRRFQSPVIDAWIWEARLDPHHPLFENNRLYDRAAVPAGVMFEAALAASHEIVGNGHHALEGFRVDRLPVVDEHALIHQTIVSAVDPGSLELRLYSRDARPEEGSDEWTSHASCRLVSSGAPKHKQVGAEIRETRETRCQDEMSGAEFYDLLGDAALTSHQRIESVRRRDGEVTGRLRAVGSTEEGNDPAGAPSGVIDACFQLLLAALPGMPAFEPGAAVYAPRSVERLRLLGQMSDTLNGHGEVRPGNPERREFECDLQLFDDEGRVVLELVGAVIGPLGSEMCPEASDGRLQRWLYDVSWEAAPPHPDGAKAPPDSPRRWVILAGRGGVGETLARLLEQRGQDTTLAVLGEQLAAGDAGELTGESGPRNELAELLARVDSDGEQTPPYSLVALWSLDQAPPNGDATDVSASVAASCDRFLSLVHAIAHREEATNPVVTMVTSGAQPVGGENAPLALCQTPLWGMSRVLANEHPEIPSRIVDLDPAADTERMASDLARELLAHDLTENQVAFRGGERFVPRLVRHPLATVHADVPLDLSSGAYLVTGGLGGLGLSVARLLVERGARHLFLMGRSGASKQAEQTLLELASAGAEVVVLKADVSDLEQTRQAFAEIDSAGVPLRGVVHSAGLIDDALLLHQNLARLKPVLAPKVDGSWNLHQLTQDRELEFFVLFSSASTLFGGPGQGNYTAANAFMDGLAHQRRADGQPALSINWGAWGQVGMAAAMGTEAHERWAASGVGEINPLDGVEALALALREDVPQMAIVPINWRLWQRAYPGTALPPFVAGLVDERTGEQIVSSALGAELQALLAAEDGERKGPMTDYVTRHVASLLALPAATMDVERSVADLGFDSLMAMEMKNRIELELGIVVPVAHLLDGPSVSKLTSRLLAELEKLSVAESQAPVTEGLEAGGSDDAQDWEEGEL